jgi:hypothetical protein
MALHWNGSRWKRAWTSPPYYGGDVSVDVGFSGLSCVCWAVGTAVSSVGANLALRWNGKAWSKF